MNKHNLLCENIHDSKFKSIEQSLGEVKDKLQVAISKKVNDVAERVVYTRDANNEIELESFSCDNQGVHPMQFLIEYGNSTDLMPVTGRYNYLKL